MPDNNEQLFQLINSQDIEVSNNQINKTVSLNIKRGLNNVIILTPEEYNKLQNIDEQANRIFHNLEINTDNSKTIKKFTEEHPEGEIISVPVGSKLASHSYTELLDELNNADLDFVKIENQNFIETLLNSGINLIGGESKLNEITLTEEEENGLNEQKKEEKLRLKKLSIITDAFVSRLKTIYPSVMFNDDLPKKDPIIGSLCYVYNDKCFYTYNSNGWASTSSEILSAISNLDKINTTLNSKANKDTATSSKNGLMSSDDKIKLDSIPNNIRFTSENAEENGETLSLVTTGEKYVWNSKTSNTGTVTKVTAGAGLTGGDITTTGTIALATSGVTESTKTKGPTADVTGTEGTTITVPQITVDTYGRVTALEEFTLTNKNTTYSNVTANESGLMTSADKIKLDSLSIIPRSDYDSLTDEDKVNIRLFFVVESDNTVTMIYNPINTPSEP